MKSKLTLEIENNLMRRLNSVNKFNCHEVGIVKKIKKPSKWDNTKLVDKFEIEICDFMSYEQDTDIFRCYEIKISKQDFYSKAKKTFVGNYNYYVMPKELYKQVKKDIPDDVGVLDKYIFCLKKPKKVKLKEDKTKLLISMLKSLNRENYKSFYKRSKPK